MKKGILYLAVAAFILLISATAWSDTYVGSVSWLNHGSSVYTANGTIWNGDDFNGVGPLSVPPYVSFVGAASMSQSGGLLNMTRPVGYSGLMNVNLPNYDASGNWQAISNATLIANFQNVDMEPDTAFGISIKSFDYSSHTTFTVGNAESLGMGKAIGVVTEIFGMPKYWIPAPAFTAIGLKIEINASGDCYFYYMLNPSDGYLSTGSEDWIQVFADQKVTFNTSALDTNISFYNNIIQTPEPATMLLLALGLLGLVGARRKIIG